MSQPPAELALVPIDRSPPSASGHDCSRRLAGAAGPGWFESSWELRRGLEVREEDVGDDHRLHGWIESFLSAQRAAARTASPSESTAIA